MKKEWTQKEFSAQLRAAASEPIESFTDSPDPDDGIAEAYRASAAVVSAFDPGTIEPFQFPVSSEKGDYTVILKDSDPVIGKTSESSWTLHRDVRGKTLRRLISDGSLREVLAETNADSSDPIFSVLKQISEGSPGGFEIEGNSAATLSAALDLLDLTGSSLRSALPPAEMIEEELGRVRLLEPFRHLSDAHFTGRDDELEELRNYVGVEKPRTIRGGLKRLFEKVVNVLGFEEKAPLMIYGPGGMGKSTLLGHFILEHATLPAKQRFPFAYLDFDRPGITGREPLTLLSEIFNQLGIQYPKIADDCSEIRNELRRHEAWAFNGDEEDSHESLESIGPERKHSSTKYERMQFVKELGGLFDRIAPNNQPLLLVLDTFEEVQYHSAPDIPELFSFLDQVQSKIPRLRVIVSGRTLETNVYPKFTPLEMAPLDRKDAVKMMVSYGVPKADSKDLARHLGGNPLTLRLAMRVYERENLDGRGIRDLSKFLEDVDDELIQGQLYARILDHIKDDSARKVAHPGLILRRITAPLIFEVLASPCGLKLKTWDQAEEVFEKLAREDTLVTREGDTLVHRNDVRRTMIELLVKAEPKKVEAIHRAAVAYYRDRDDDAARAEEIYHLYWLEITSSEDIDARWTPEVADRLENAVVEIPERLREDLKRRLGLGPGDDANERGSSSKEHSAVVNRLIDHGRYDEALKEIRSRPDIPMFNLELIVLTRMGMLGEARELGESYLEKLEARGEMSQCAEVEGSLGSIAKRRGDLKRAHHHFRRAAERAEQSSEWGRAVEFIVLALELRQGEEHKEHERSLLAELAHHVNPRQISEAPVLYRRVAEELQEFDPSLAKKIESVVVGTRTRGMKTFGTGGKEYRVGYDLLVRLHQAILRRFPETNSLEKFLVQNFGYNLHDISSGGSSESAIYDALNWFQRNGEIRKLGQALMESFPDDEELSSIWHELQ